MFLLKPRKQGFMRDGYVVARALHAPDRLLGMEEPVKKTGISSRRV
jgi:hypothetical protein